MTKNPAMTVMNRRKKLRDKYIELRQQKINDIMLLMVAPVPNRHPLILQLYRQIQNLEFLLSLPEYLHPYSYRQVFPTFQRLNLNSFPQAQYPDMFRFEKEHVQMHLNYLRRNIGLGNKFRLHYDINRDSNYYVYRLPELYLMTLYSLSRPYRVIDIARAFGRCPAEVSVGVRHMSAILCHIAQEFIQNVDPQNCWFTYREARRSAAAIAAKGCPLRNTGALVDGTHKKCCKPSEPALENICYNRYIRGHSLKFINVSTAQGLVLVNKGPYEGRLHDSTCAEEDDLYQLLSDLLSFPQNNWSAVAYSDSAFTNRVPIVTSYAPAFNDEQKKFNKDMSKGRIAVEWSFCGPVQTFQGVDFTKRNKIGHQFGRSYIVVVFLYNLHTCHYGNLTSRYFNCKPPCIEDYLRVPRNSLS